MRKTPNIVILTGAGISAESGLATFRDSDGTWNKVRVEDVATPQAFQNDPQLVNDFYNHRRKEAQHALPNNAHLALAQLEKIWPGEFLLVTQNVDNLHEKAGSTHMVHMHGSLTSALCLSCRNQFVWTDDIDEKSSCPHCFSIGMIRPNIVWFGEMPYHMVRIEEALSNSDIFVSIGTSGQVYPAAGFVTLAKAVGAFCVEINLNTNNDISDLFDEHITGPASKTVPIFVKQLSQKIIGE